MPTVTAGCPSCLAAEDQPALQGDELLRPLLPALLPWLVTRRWFTHESGCLQDLRPISDSVLTSQDRSAVLVHALLDAQHTSGAARRYQLLLGLRRRLPARLAGALIGQAVGGRWDGWWLYEASEDPELMGLVLERTQQSRSRSLRLTLTRPGSVPAGLTPRLLDVEQSNTSVVYGNRLMLKFFRQPQPGAHPEVEVLSALTAGGSTATPRLVGRLHTGDTVLGVLQEFLPADGSGWDLAVGQAAESLRGQQGSFGLGGFSADAYALGGSVAQVHRLLARHFPCRNLTQQQICRQADELIVRLREAVDTVPQLEPYAGRITELYEDFARVASQGRGLAGQRIHGDLHLGQVLRTQTGWKVIDFEGEPGRPTTAQDRPQPVLRDVAGMLRSFEYAAEQALGTVLTEDFGRLDEPLPQSQAARIRHSRRAQAWAVRGRRAFIAGYAAGGSVDPYCHPVVLRAFEADKAVYEAVYEARHRPEWLPIPLTAVHRLVAGR
ncbi:maltokinase N-terminal cap-like domain-containing protein [Kitasatospora sp. LaBMicrA B282]|uniref:maltokinase N-terminal cap-like domain-containing protein n=1 Tax=Kitasatospora sp. LaBMicrA B282 TaxID=3420949 RepID=UPI003D105E07